MRGSEGPGDAPPHRTPDEGRARHTKPVQQRQQQRYAARIGIVACWIGAGQAEARQVHADDAVIGLQQGRPVLPGVQAGAEAVQHDDGRRIARAGIAHMKPDAGDLDEGGGWCGIGRFQRPAWLVGRIEPEAAAQQHNAQQHSNDGHGASHSNLPQPKRSGRPRRRYAGHGTICHQPDWLAIPIEGEGLDARHRLTHRDSHRCWPICNACALPARVACCHGVPRGRSVSRSNRSNRPRHACKPSGFRLRPTGQRPLA